MNNGNFGGESTATTGRNGGGVSSGSGSGVGVISGFISGFFIIGLNIKINVPPSR